MITKSNFKDLLVSLNFTNHGEVYEKKFPQYNTSMSVDFSKKTLYYPEIMNGRERNNNFDASENFVVFECVNRLLEKGYRPENIELEKEWHLGHNAKSGRADICVTDFEGSMLFIIECKTWGKEFEKALSNTKIDGSQLFSYWQQEQSCKWLVLYTSDFKDDKVEYKAPTINCSDDANILLLAKKDKSIKLYRDAHTVQEKYTAWKETYASHIDDNLIFDDSSIAYKIGVKPLLKKNLRDFTPDDKIVNKFEEILRHNNVSDKENAFNRLIALFICKLVDESTKNEDDEVEFQYKQGTDTYETLQDRLQRLHRDGMEKFMKEKIYYVSADYPEWLFSTYTGSKRKKAIEDLQNTLRILKFYSNNDFAFKDVHNEELFYQNGRILVEMVQLFEKYRIIYPSKHQFLGDLFEQFLNKGFKQNEGQFFTPIPITRFIWDSLPVDHMIKSDRGTVYPKVIDYACGAGHFLTEAIEAINYFAHPNGNNAWVRDHIFGIEKDYRLARVAKISLFMNGAGEGNIIFGDGLENTPDKGIENGIFDILVANPPYSVKDFKQHLQLKNNSFTLLERIGPNSGEIETLFVERINQLLKPRGIAAVILPSSILSNDSSSYIGAREQLLQNFYIRAIVALGSKTFGATTTNTVIMFLEKFNEPPKQIDLSADSIDAIFRGAKLTNWKDNEILEAYTTQIEIEKEVYKSFLNKNYTIDELNNIEYFKIYVGAFANSTEAKNLQNKKSFKSMNSIEQTIAYLEKFYSYAHSIEREKLFYFSLVYQQTTIIINAPIENKEQKNFLGYDWSNRKGNEGIQIITAGGKMYNSSNRSAQGTLASAIKKSFNGVIPSFTQEQQTWSYVINTKDMLDFSSVVFKKTLRQSIKKSIELSSKYPLKNLFDIATLFRGVTYDKADQRLFKTSNVVLTSDSITLDGRFVVTKQIFIDENKIFSDESRLKASDIFICMSSGSKKHVGKVAYIKSDTNYYAGGFMGIIRTNTTDCISKYLYYILNTPVIKNILVGESAGSNINNLSNRIGSIKIPIPPIDIQKRIINECSKIDEEYETTRMSIETYQQKIEALFSELDVANTTGGYKLSDIFDLITDKISATSITTSAYITTDTMLQKCTGIREYTEALPSTNITAFQINDILLSNIRPYLQKLWLATFNGGCSNDVLVLRIKDSKKNNPAFFASYLKRQQFFDYIMQDVNGVKMPRGKKSHIMSYPMPIVNLQLQNEIVNKITVIEQKIKKAEQHLVDLSKKHKDILNQFLKK